MGHFKNKSTKKVSTKLRKEDCKYRFFVHFLPEYQDTTSGTFNYLSKNKTDCWKMIQRLFKNTISGKYYKAMLYEINIEENGVPQPDKCLLVWMRGKERMTYEQYVQQFQNSDEAPLRAWVKLKPGPLRTNRMVGGLAENITWSGGLFEDAEKQAKGKDVMVYYWRKRLMCDDLRYAFAECRLYQKSDNKHVGTINHLGALIFEDPDFKQEIESAGNYARHQLGIF